MWTFRCKSNNSLWTILCSFQGQGLSLVCGSWETGGLCFSQPVPDLLCDLGSCLPLSGFQQHSLWNASIRLIASPGSFRSRVLGCCHLFWILVITLWGKHIYALYRWRIKAQRRKVRSHQSISGAFWWLGSLVGLGLFQAVPPRGRDKQKERGESGQSYTYIFVLPPEFSYCNAGS